MTSRLNMLISNLLTQAENSKDNKDVASPDSTKETSITEGEHP